MGKTTSTPGNQLGHDDDEGVKFDDDDDDEGDKFYDDDDDDDANQQ